MRIKKKNNILIMFMFIITLFLFPVNVSASGCDSYVQSQMTKMGLKASDYTCTDNISNKCKTKYSVKMLNNGGDPIYVCTDKQIDFEAINVQISNGSIVVEGLNSDQDQSWNSIFDNYRTVVLIVSGIGFLTCLLAFILMFIRLGGTSDRPIERRKYIVGILFAGIGTVGLGAVFIIVRFFYNVF